MNSIFKGPQALNVKIDPILNNENDGDPLDGDSSKASFNEKEIKIENSPQLEIPQNQLDSQRRPSKLKKMYSSLLQTVSSMGNSFWGEIKFVLINIFSIHILVMLLTFGAMLLQNYVDEFCWYGDTCNCKNSFLIKIYATIKFILLFFAFVAFLLFNTGIEIALINFRFKKIIKFVFYVITLLEAFAYLIISNAEILDLAGIPIIFMIFFSSLGFQIIFLCDKKFNFRSWLDFLKKTNSIPAMIYLHFMFCFYCFPQISNYILTVFGNYVGKNVNSLIFNIYFTGYSIIFPKLCCSYHKYLRSLENEDFFPTIILIRVSIVFSLSVPISMIISMENEDWGCWISLVSYTNFIISWYTRKSLVTFLLEKIVRKFCVNKQKILRYLQTNYTGYDLECRQLISGCLVDLVFIVNFRLMIINFYNEWFQVAVYRIYYKNCKFEISNAFRVSNLGVYSLFSINLIVTLTLLGYMMKTKQQLFEYIITKNHLMNIYILFLVHGLFDTCLQLFCHILEQK